MSQTPFTAEREARRPSPSRPWATWLLLGLSLCLAGCGSRPSETPVDSDLPSIDGPNLFPFCEGDLWGYIDRSGEVVVEPRYSWVLGFSDGLALVRSSGDYPSYAYIDERAEVVCTLPRECCEAQGFSEGLAAVAYAKAGGPKWGFIDKQGHIVVEPKYDLVRPFSEGRAAVNVGATYQFAGGMRGGEWGYIDNTGREIVPPAFWTAYDFSEGLARIDRDTDHDEYIDRTGKVVLTLPREFGDAESFSEGLAAVLRMKGGEGYIDKTGKIVIDLGSGKGPYAPREFSEGLAAAGDGEKMGYMDHTGQFVIQPQFEEGRSFSEGLAAVRIGDHWGYINKPGKFAVDPSVGRADGPGPINDPGTFAGGLARVHIGGTLRRVMDAPDEWIGGAWYYINRSGEIVHLYQRDPKL